MDARPGRPFVSVKFSPTGRRHSYFLPEAAEPAGPADDGAPKPGDEVVVQGHNGPALGTVVPLPPALALRRAPSVQSEHKVVRIVAREDVAHRLKQQQRELEAHRICLMKIRERGMPMKLTRVEQLYDGSRLIFYYTADGRVDFRELVRELAAHFRTRIEMRQIGVRDEAKMLGGYGSCGRPLCCTTWLQGFAPVSIKMAKQQHLSLNPTKLSGQCGRLKCCLRYEMPDGKGVDRNGCADEPVAGAGHSAGRSAGLPACRTCGCGSGGCGCDSGGGCACRA